MFIGNESIQDKANVRKPGDLQLLGFSTLSREGLLEFCIRDCLQREDSIGFETFSSSALSSRTGEIPRTSRPDLHKGDQSGSCDVQDNQVEQAQARGTGADAPSFHPDRQADIFETEARWISSLGWKVNETTTRHVPDISEVRRAHDLSEAMRSDAPARREYWNDIRLFSFHRTPSDPEERGMSWCGPRCPSSCDDERRSRHLGQGISCAKAQDQAFQTDLCIEEKEVAFRETETLAPSAQREKHLEGDVSHSCERNPEDGQGSDRDGGSLLEYKITHSKFGEMLQYTNFFNERRSFLEEKYLPERFKA